MSSESFRIHLSRTAQCLTQCLLCSLVFESVYPLVFHMFVYNNTTWSRRSSSLIPPSRTSGLKRPEPKKRPEVGSDTVRIFRLLSPDHVLLGMDANFESVRHGWRPLQRPGLNLIHHVCPSASTTFGATDS